MTTNMSPDNNDASSEQELEAERLLERIVDSEASSEDRARFELLADRESLLWRTLALRQQEMAVLAESVAQRIEGAEQIDLSLGDERRRINLPVTLSGWAAVVILGLWWGLLGGGGGEGGRDVDGLLPAANSGAGALALTAQEYFRKYLEAGRREGLVIGELDPILLQTEPMSDGRHRIRFVRRIEEYAVVESPPALGEKTETPNATEGRQEEGARF